MQLVHGRSANPAVTFLHLFFQRHTKHFLNVKGGKKPLFFQSKKIIYCPLKYCIYKVFPEKLIK